jgi:AraC family transcriptional activator of pobA
MPRPVQPGSQPAVPVFFLFGEPRRFVGPRFLHLEPLEERSRPTDWMIRPHTHADLHHLFLITEGAGQVSADGIVTRFAAPCLLIVPARVVHGFFWQPETCGQVLTLSDSYLRELLARTPDFAVLFDSACCLALAGDHQVGENLRRLEGELASTLPGHEAAIEAQLLGALVAALRLRQAGPRSRPAPGRETELVARFRQAVERFYRSGHSVEMYAGLLGVSQVQLRRACAQVNGRAPARLITDRLFLEAQRLLLYSNMPVGEAAAHLGFEDPAYFSRFFTQRAGQSPRAFRAAGGRAGSR